MRQVLNKMFMGVNYMSHGFYSKTESLNRIDIFASYLNLKKKRIQKWDLADYTLKKNFRI